MLQKIIILASIAFCCLACQTSNDSDTSKFILLSQSLEHSMEGAQRLNERRLTELKKKVEEEGNSPEGLTAVKRAEELKSKTNEALKIIEKLKREIRDHLRAGAGIDPHTDAVKNTKEVNGVKTIMIGTNKQGKGYQLEKDLNQYVVYLNKQFVEDKTLGFAGRFEGIAKGNEEVKMYEHNYIQRSKDFANANFGQTRVVAALAILTQRQSEIIRYEQEVLKKLGAGDLRRLGGDGRILAVASADANVVVAGRDYTAQLFITTTHTKSGARMTFNGQPIRVNAGGIGEVGFIATGKGKQTWTGTVTINQRGKDTTFTLKKEYEVIDPIKR